MTQRNYGFLHPGNDDVEITIPKGQNIAGYSVGIMYLDDVWYPFMPGNVVNATTYDFPVRLLAVPNLNTPRLHSGDPNIAQEIISVAKHLVEKEGCRAIASACGFFGHFHSHVADAIDAPVALSSMVQLPWIQSLLKSSQQIGILSANAVAVTDSLLKSCRVDRTDNLVIANLRHESQFSAIMEDRGNFHNGTVRKEVVGAAMTLVKNNPDIGAILLECSDMPPYASDIQRAVQLPVFDFITMIRWLHNATTQKPYQGFI